MNVLFYVVISIYLKIPYRIPIITVVQKIIKLVIKF